MKIKIKIDDFVINCQYDDEVLFWHNKRLEIHNLKNVTIRNAILETINVLENIFLGSDLEINNEFLNTHNISASDMMVTILPLLFDNIEKAAVLKTYKEIEYSNISELDNNIYSDGTHEYYIYNDAEFIDSARNHAEDKYLDMGVSEILENHINSYLSEIDVYGFIKAIEEEDDIDSDIIKTNKKNILKWYIEEYGEERFIEIIENYGLLDTYAMATNDITTVEEAYNEYDSDVTYYFEIVTVDETEFHISIKP